MATEQWDDTLARENAWQHSTIEALRFKVESLTLALRSIAAEPWPDLAAVRAFAKTMTEPVRSEACYHESLSGIDDTPLDSAAKVWRCDACHALVAGRATDSWIKR